MSNYEKNVVTLQKILKEPFKMKKQIYTKINRENYSVIDNTTGEIVSGVTTIHTSCIDEFIMFFFKSIPVLMNLDGNTFKVLMYCWKYSAISPKDQSNYIINDKIFKEDLATLTNGELTENVINKAISQCKKMGLLIRKSKGRYMLNPDYFYKGSLSDRSNLQIQINYKPTDNKNFDNNEEN